MSIRRVFIVTLKLAEKFSNVIMVPREDEAELVAGERIDHANAQSSACFPQVASQLFHAKSHAFPSFLVEVDDLANGPLNGVLDGRVKLPA